MQELVYFYIQQQLPGKLAIAPQLGNCPATWQLPGNLAVAWQLGNCLAIIWQIGNRQSSSWQLPLKPAQLPNKLAVVASKLAFVWQIGNCQAKTGSKFIFQLHSKLFLAILLPSRARERNSMQEIGRGSVEK